MIADKEEAGRKHARAVATALHGVARSVKFVELPDCNGKPVKDAADFCSTGGTPDQLKAILESASQFLPTSEPRRTKPSSTATEYLGRDESETGEEVVARLAALSSVEYGRVRHTEADALGIRVSTMDAEVEKRRTGTAGKLQGCAVELQDVEPWSGPVRGADVLNEVADTAA